MWRWAQEKEDLSKIPHFFLMCYVFILHCDENILVCNEPITDNFKTGTLFAINQHCQLQPTPCSAFDTISCYLFLLRHQNFQRPLFCCSSCLSGSLCLNKDEKILLSKNIWDLLASISFLFRRQNEQRGLTVSTVTHIHHESLLMFDKFMWNKKGTFNYDTTGRTFIKDPRFTHCWNP